ncbi:MAG: ABC transporter permease subunit [Chryseolinea sp.]
MIASLWGARTLAFTFEGLVIASVLYSMPFVVQPIRNAFEAIGDRPLEVAATLRASPWDAFWSVAVPLARPGFMTATVLGFAHTVGEFGVVLMIGGNIPEPDQGDVGRDLRLRRDAALDGGARRSRAAWWSSRSR